MTAPTESEFQSLFNDSPLAMWVFDGETLSFLAVNKAAVRYYGFSERDFLSMTIDGIRFPEDRPALRVALERFRREEAGLARKPCRWRHCKKDGTPLYVEMLWQQVTFNGRSSVLATVVDFAEHLDAETRPIDTLQAYPAPAINDTFWDWDLRAETAVSDGSGRSFLHSARSGWEPRFDWWYQRIHQEDRDRVAGNLRNLISSGKEVWEEEYRYRRADGEFVQVVDRGYLVRDEHGEPIRMVGTLVDVTLRRRAEQQARLYGDIINYMRTGLYVHRMENLEDDSSFRVLLANPASEQITGVRAGDLVGKPLEECFPGLRERGILNTFAEVVRTGKDVQFDDFTYEDGRVAPAHFSARYFPLPNQCVGVAFENITQRLNTEEQFRRVENRYQILAALVPVGIFQTDTEGKCNYVNKKCCELSGASADGLLGRKWTAALHPEDRKRISNLWLSTFRRRVPFHAEYRLLHPDGSIVWVLGQAVPEYSGSEFVGYIGSLTDFTEQKRLEHEITEIRTQEQQRIGQALHDRLGQHLTGIAFLAKALAGKLATQSPAGAGQAEEISSLINQAILRTRDLARMLHPVELEESGLVAAFHDLVSNSQRIFNIRCHFQCDPSIIEIDNAIAVHLYHVAQEAITNAVKHGHATRVTVELGHENDHGILRIEDNGDGMMEASGGAGIGLRIMRHRASMIEGELQVQPSEHGGTILTCTFAGKSLRSIGGKA